jgi:hypothetical protein
MRTHSLRALFVASALLLGACFHHSYTVGSGAPNGRIVYEKWHAHWLFAIIGEENVNVNAVCPSGNATVRNDVTFVNGLIGALIGWIYYPTTVVVYCADGPAAGAPMSLQLTPEQSRKLVESPEFSRWVAEVAAAPPAVH